MSRQPIGKGERVTIILNPAFPKEKVILNHFSKSLNRSADIKEILYNHAITNQLSNNDNIIINNCVINDNSIIKECSMNDNLMMNKLSNNDNSSTYNNEEKINSKNDFNINLDNIEDTIVKIETNPEEEIKKANNNALDFIKNGFK